MGFRPISLTCSSSTLRFESSCNVLNKVVAFWATCSKNMLIFFKVYVERPKIKTCWNPKNYGFFICTSSTTCWTNWNDSIATIASSVMETISSTNTTSSVWMLSITWSKLGSGSSSMLICVIMASSSSPPLPPISFEQVHFSSFFESLTSDPKVVLDFYFCGEVTTPMFNMSLGVGYKHLQLMGLTCG